MLQLLKLPDQTVRVLVEGKSRARVTAFTPRTDFFQAVIEKIEDEPGDASETEALMRTAKTNFEQYIKLNKKIPSETLASVAQIDDPAKLADTIASHLSVKISDRQQLLETLSTDRAAGAGARSDRGRRSACFRSSARSAPASSARWRRRSANII